MPKTYTEGHKAREITLAEAAIVKLREAQAKQQEWYDDRLAKIMKARQTLDETRAVADAQLQRSDWDRKIEAAEAHLAWLRAMPVPTEAAPDAAQ